MSKLTPERESELHQKFVLNADYVWRDRLALVEAFAAASKNPSGAEREDSDDAFVYVFDRNSYADHLTPKENLTNLATVCRAIKASTIQFTPYAKCENFISLIKGCLTSRLPQNDDAAIATRNTDALRAALFTLSQELTPHASGQAFKQVHDEWVQKAVDWTKTLAAKARAQRDAEKKALDDLRTRLTVAISTVCDNDSLINFLESIKYDIRSKNAEDILCQVLKEKNIHQYVKTTQAFRKLMSKINDMKTFSIEPLTNRLLEFFPFEAILALRKTPEDIKNINLYLNTELKQQLVTASLPSTPAAPSIPPRMPTAPPPPPIASPLLPPAEEPPAAWPDHSLWTEFNGYMEALKEKHVALRNRNEEDLALAVSSFIKAFEQAMCQPDTFPDTANILTQDLKASLTRRRQHLPTHQKILDAILMLLNQIATAIQKLCGQTPTPYPIAQSPLSTERLVQETEKQLQKKQVSPRPQQ